MVARSLGMPSAQVLNGVLHSLNLLHNISAHHGRIWNRLIVKRLPKIKKVPSFLVMGKVDGEGLQPSKPREWRMGEKAARVTHGAKVMAPSVD